MNKTLIVARREFLSRVQKKTFLLTTIGLPLLFFGFYAGIIYYSVKSTENFRIAVADEANVFNGKIDSKDKEIQFVFVKNQTVQSLKKQVEENKMEAFVFVPTTFNAKNVNDSLQVVSGKSVGLMTRGKIKDILKETLEEKKLDLTRAQLDSMQKSSKITFASMQGSNDSESKVGISYIIGYASGFLIYIILFIYGTMVMRGVMEEKTNRIAEVIVSSVKPFQLMMGKIIGIGTVGLTQFLIWIVLVVCLRYGVAAAVPSMADQMQTGTISAVFNALGQANWLLILGCFIFYFLGGYFLYSALFASVGCTVNEDPQDAQSLILPITFPIIFAMVIMTKAVNDPNSSLAVFGSLFPLTSPIVMMARIAHGVPDGVSVVQLLLSMAFLVIGFVGTTWLAAKIYRTGILMYGKKATWKTMMKWAFKKS
jgi:ABC-2 type transport system permease protein